MKEIKDGTSFTNSHWINLTEAKQIILVDFDHTITKKCLACKDGLENDGVQEDCKEALTLLSKDYQIWIYTGNYDLLDEQPSEKAPVKRSVESIRKFLEENGIPFDRILQTKPPAVFIIDDRAIHHKSWFHTLTEIETRCKP